MYPFDNYCGPYWSAGKFQSSVVSDVEPLSELDALCREHDAAYATGEDLKYADSKFASQAWKLGGLASVAGALVGIQGSMRASDKLERLSKMKQQKKNLRGGPSPGAAAGTVKKLTRNDMVASAPVAFATKRTGVAAKVRTRADGVVEISHRSFLQPVNNDINFTVAGIPCNPGMSGSFPWLSKLARRYEEYRFKRLRYEYRSVASSSTAGVIMMSFDYDSADLAPSSKANQAQTIPNSEANVWVNNELVVQPKSEFKNVRAGKLDANLDVKTYDMGQLWLSSAYGNGVTGGELYVEYTVELRKPSYGPEVSGSISATGTSASAPFNSVIVYTGSANPLERVDATYLRVVAGGEYLLTATAYGNATLTAGPAGLTIISGGNTKSSVLETVVSATIATTVYKIQVNTGDTINWTTIASGSGLTSCRVRVATADYDSL